MLLRVVESAGVVQMTTDVAAELEVKRAGLEAELAVLSAPTGEQGSISFGKRVGEGTTAAIDRFAKVGAHGHLLQVLDDVRRAQVKLAEGTYGRCDRCGAAIGADRLEALPWAVRCVRDAGAR